MPKSRNNSLLIHSYFVARLPTGKFHCLTSIVERLDSINIASTNFAFDGDQRSHFYLILHGSNNVTK